jgi:hypothetical protein
MVEVVDVTTPMLPDLPEIPDLWANCCSVCETCGGERKVTFRIRDCGEQKMFDVRGHEQNSKQSVTELKQVGEFILIS